MISAGASESAIAKAEAGIRLVIERTAVGTLGELSLDRLDLFLGSGSKGHQIFDAVFGWGRRLIARQVGADRGFLKMAAPEMVGIDESEAILPRVRPSFEGYRLLREYFLLPERFHFVRFSGLREVVRTCEGQALELIILFDKPQSDISDVNEGDFVPFVTPIVNLFERECNIVELDPRRTSHVVHADRTRPRDFEIYRLLRIEDAERDGPNAKLAHLYGMDQLHGSNLVFSTDRRPRRPSNDEIAANQMRTSYSGDDFLISVARPPNARDAVPVRRLDIRALCTNRDLPILDDTPKLTLESGDPVGEVRLLQAVRRPRPSLSAELPDTGRSEAEMEDLTWRWIAQLSLSQLSIAEDGPEPLRALISLYADRGDPAYARHGRSVTTAAAMPVMDRVAVPGPICFAHGTEVTLDIDEGVLSGSSRLLLSALLARLFARHTAINSFVRTKSKLTLAQEEVKWPSVTGTRNLM